MATQNKQTASLRIQVAEQPNLIIDGKTYPVANLSHEIQDMLALYQRWETERNEAQLEADKCHAAMQSIQNEIAQRIHGMEAAAQASIDGLCDAAA